ASGTKPLRSLDDAILKINQNGNRWLAEAKSELAQNGSGGPWNGFGLEPAFAGAYGGGPSRFAGLPAEPSKTRPVVMLRTGDTNAGNDSAGRKISVEERAIREAERVFGLKEGEITPESVEAAYLRFKLQYLRHLGPSNDLNLLARAKALRNYLLLKVCGV